MVHHTFHFRSTEIYKGGKSLQESSRNGERIRLKDLNQPNPPPPAPPRARWLSVEGEIELLL